MKYIKIILKICYIILKCLCLCNNNIYSDTLKVLVMSSEMQF